MGHRTSYSQNNTYIACPKHWHNLYVEKLKPIKEGASLFFGSAIDAAVMELLKGDPNYKKKFYDRWEAAFQNGQMKKLFDNDDVVYSYSDFDSDLLEEKDLEEMKNWIKELNLESISSDPVECYKSICKIKKNPYKKTTDNHMKYFNRCSWISLKRKGAILVEAFKEQFYPKIKKVISTQKHGKIEDTYSGDSISGFIDMILEIEGYDKPIIFDLKTSATPYTQDQIDLTEQLTLYSAFESANINTNLVGYVVLCKNIQKEVESKCSLCNNLKTGRHQTCDAVDSAGNRCGGAWNEKKLLKPQVQVLVEEKSPKQIQELLGDISNIVLAMKNGIVYKNTSKCNNWYGGKCAFYDLCHNGKTEGLIKK